MSTTELVRCLACGVMNRVPVDVGARGRRAVCGRCKRPLGGLAAPVKVTDATFATEVEQSPVPVVVDLWAAWCGPCRMLEPVIAELADELAGRLRFAKLNVDENPATAARFNVRSIPTLLFFKGGEVVGQVVGAVPRAQIEQRIKQYA